MAATPAAQDRVAELGHTGMQDMLLEKLGYLVSDHHCSQRQHRVDHGRRHDVGNHIPVTGGEPLACAPKACLSLFKDE
jgi:hypothetical protein